MCFFPLLASKINTTNRSEIVPATQPYVCWLLKAWALVAMWNPDVHFREPRCWKREQRKDDAIFPCSSDFGLKKGWATRDHRVIPSKEFLMFSTMRLCLLARGIYTSAFSSGKHAITPLAKCDKERRTCCGLPTWCCNHEAEFHLAIILNTNRFLTHITSSLCVNEAPINLCTCLSEMLRCVCGGWPKQERWLVVNVLSKQLTHHHQIWLTRPSGMIPL
jgi:hypothetical protein